MNNRWVMTSLVGMFLGVGLLMGMPSGVQAQSTCSTDADCGLALRCGANCGSASQCQWCESPRVCVDLTGDGYTHCEVLSSCDWSDNSACNNACCDGCKCYTPPEPTNTPPPATPTPKPLLGCTVVTTKDAYVPGETVTVTLVGESAPDGEVAQMHLQRDDRSTLPDLPVVDPPVDPAQAYNGNGAYKLGQCTFSGGTCSLEVDVSGLPEGGYYAQCHIYESASNKCSGNVFCAYEHSDVDPTPLAAAYDCNTWYSCDGTAHSRYLPDHDNDYFVVAPPTLTCDGMSMVPASAEVSFASTAAVTLGGTATGTVDYSLDCGNSQVITGSSGSGAFSVPGCVYDVEQTYTATLTATRQGLSTTCTASVEGTAPPLLPLTVEVYQDETLSCVETGLEIGTTATIYVDGPGSDYTYGTYSNTNTSYLQNVPPGVYQYDESASTIPSGLNLLGPACSNPTVNVDGVNDVMKLFFAKALPGWWQTEAGDVLSNGGSIFGGDLPASVDAARRYLSLDGSHESGVGMAVGTIQTGAGNMSEGANWRASGLSPAYDTSVKTENYCYFWDLFQMLGDCDGTAAKDDFALNGWGSALVPEADLSTGSMQSMPPGGWASADTRVFYYGGPSPLVIDRDLMAGATGDFVVPANRKYVIFTTANVQIENFDPGAGVLQVEKGGFFGVIARGNIIVQPSVGTLSTNASGDPLSPESFLSVADQPSIAGVYIADGVFTINPSSRQFVGEGMFVGWQNLNTGRNLAGLNNNLYPAEYFIYRPDFLLSAPGEFKRTNYVWDEIAPRDLVP